MLLLLDIIKLLGGGVEHVMDRGKRSEQLFGSRGLGASSREQEGSREEEEGSEKIRSYIRASSS